MAPAAEPAGVLTSAAKKGRLARGWGRGGSGTCGGACGGACDGTHSVLTGGGGGSLKGGDGRNQGGRSDVVCG
jgi:hypothetical protein